MPFTLTLKFCQGVPLTCDMACSILSLFAALLDRVSLRHLGGQIPELNQLFVAITRIIFFEGRVLQMATTMGKRYVCTKCGSEVLVTKASKGDLKCCGTPMNLK